MKKIIAIICLCGLSISHAFAFCVAVGSGGIMCTSLDGIHWTPQNSGTIEQLNGVATDGSLWVTVGAKGTILNSTNGQSWYPQKSGTTKGLSGVAWNKGTWIVVGADGTVLTSIDSITWTPQKSGAKNFLSDVACNKEGFWVAVGHDGTILNSTDRGITWTPRESHSPGGNLVGVASNDDRWVATNYIAANGVCTSIDGKSWSYRGTKTIAPYRVAWSKEKKQWLIVGFRGYVYISNDGEKWELHLSGNYTWMGITWAKDKWIAAGYGGGGQRTICSSTDGITWHMRFIDEDRNMFVSVASN